MSGFRSSTNANTSSTIAMTFVMRPEILYWDLRGKQRLFARILVNLVVLIKILIWRLLFLRSIVLKTMFASRWSIVIV